MKKSSCDFLNRRQFLKRSVHTAGSTLALGFAIRVKSEESPFDPAAAKAYLRSIMPTRERVAQFTEVMSAEESVRRSNGWTYDAELGWVHCPAVHPNGVGKSKTFYQYEPDGARRIVHFADQPGRIHAYGNSFTHCDQVSDGETWEEYLAAHLQEPIRNYGVGGYSVYQAYRRMLKVEAVRSAPCLLLNIYDDDHYRNLDAWRSIRAGPRSQCGFTLPHLRVHVREGRSEQVENLLTMPGAVRKLRDEDYLWKTFQNDPVLHLRMALLAPDELSPKQVEALAERFGVTEGPAAGETPAERLQRIHAEAALFATKQVVTLTEQFAQRTGKKLMLMLSFGTRNMADALEGKPRFDQSFVDWLKNKPYPVIDMRDAFRQEFSQYRGGAGEFLQRYYNGHHSPAGNFFTAWTLKDQIVPWLDPAPRPYQ